MKIKNLTLGMALSLNVIFTSQWVLATPLRLGVPAYGGSGCPAGTASVVVSPDQTAISILFDQFIAESGGSTGRRFDRKSCNLAIPVYVPGGYSVSIIAVDYRGFNVLPSGARSRFEAEYFWSGARGPRIIRDFFGPLNQGFSVRDELAAHSYVWTPCGASVNLRVNASIYNQTNYWQQQTLTSIDSADVTGQIVFHLNWRRCY